MPEPKALAVEVTADDFLREQLHELRDAVRETVYRVVQEIHAAVGRVHAVDVLSMWEGFGRFCRETLEMEPLVLVRAYGLQREDPAEVVLGMYADAKPDEAEATRSAAQWIRGWKRRFKPQA